MSPISPKIVDIMSPTHTLLQILRVDAATVSPGGPPLSENVRAKKHFLCQFIKMYLICIKQTPN